MISVLENKRMMGNVKIVMVMMGVLALFAAIVYGVLYTKMALIEETGANIAADVALPPIDLSAPVDIEVATFALG